MKTGFRSAASTAVAAASSTSLPLHATASKTSSATAIQATSSGLAALIEGNHYILLIEQYGPYGYQPGLFWAMFFSALYALSGMVHIGEMANTRHWWLFTLVFGCFAEAVGNGIRIYSHFEPRMIDPYIAQQVILVVTPVFFAAIHYTILGRIIELFGQDFTLRYLKPSAIIPAFVGADLLSLGIQGAGSGLAAVAEVNGRDTKPGGTIVVVGLCVQLAAYLCFQLLIFTFFWRCSKKPIMNKNLFWTQRFRRFLFAFLLSSVLVLGRSIFRTIEMITGWIGPVSTVEWYYYAFDAAPVCAAVILLNVFHPGFVMPSNHRDAVKRGRVRRGEDTQSEQSGKRRPSSSWFGGSVDDVLENSAEMEDVAVISSSRRLRNGSGLTQPHFRTNSLVWSTFHNARSAEKSRPVPSTSEDEMYEEYFGWSHPRSPGQNTRSQFGTPEHLSMANYRAPEPAYFPATMSCEGFDYVAAIPTKGDPSSPGGWSSDYIHTTASQLSVAHATSEQTPSLQSRRMPSP